MAITLEAIRAAGGIVHSDGNIFFRDISMLQGLAGAAPAAVAPRGEYPHEQMDAMALDRYKVVPSNASMLWSHAVVAGDGTQQLYVGREVECQNMVRKFAGAFLDGAFAFHSTAAAPTAQAAPALEAPAAPLDDSELEDLAHSANQECLSFGMSLDPFLRLAKTVRDRMLAAAPQTPAQEAPAAPAVPAGFALVPIEPTQQMLNAGRWSGAGSVSIQEEWARKEMWSRMLATITPPPAAYTDDLVALVENLAQALSAAAPDNDLAGHALNYLKRNGLQESPLRASEAAPRAPAAPADMSGSFVEWFSKNYPGDTIIVNPAWHARSIFHMAQAHARLAAGEAPAAPAVDAFTHAELLEIKRGVEELADCNETDVDYDLLMRAAQAGYLECTQFHVLNQSALDLDTVAAAQAKEGGAA
ncbi:hypothetical protein [Delftia tsuruhatensis]|uniref:hypothetical protein n=2 Tax=Pseudomonadota TaxID=1224 RepID=UPI00062D8558|nr:hypothetical protein [Delftia tsuruhatensis]WQM82182.1 hypothetical protein RNT40_26315 [Delftia tsuruhatensis]